MKKSFLALVAGALTAIGINAVEARNPLDFMVRSEPSITADAEPLADWKAPAAAKSVVEFVDYDDGGCDVCESCCDPCWEELECCCGQITGYGILGYDSFQGQPDAIRGANYGAIGGANVGGLIPQLHDYGIGWQAGATFGIFDWNGRVGNKDDSTQNMFFSTLGTFKRADACNPFSWAIAFDQLAATRFGQAAQSPYLTQIRWLSGYALNTRNEVGLWGTAATNRSNRGARTYRAVTQLNAYLHHKTDFGADAWLWTGSALRDQLNVNQGTLGGWIIGAAAIAPIADNLSFYGNFTYMAATAGSGLPSVAGGDTYNVGIGLMWFPGCNARSCTVGGQPCMPLLPVANNGNFLVEGDVVLPQ